jgi:hypothetical protein
MALQMSGERPRKTIESAARELDAREKHRVKFTSEYIPASSEIPPGPRPRAAADRPPRGGRSGDVLKLLQKASRREAAMARW